MDDALVAALVAFLTAAAALVRVEVQRRIEEANRRELADQVHDARRAAGATRRSSDHEDPGDSG